MMNDTIENILKKMYLIKDIVQDSYNIRSDVFIYIENYQFKQSVMSFSTHFRELLSRSRQVYDNNANPRLTTRFALFLEVFAELYQGRLKPMREYLEKYTDVTRFLYCNFHILENLYYAYKGNGSDMILLDEFSLLLDEDYNVLRVDLVKNSDKSDNEAMKKEHLQAFFQRITVRKDTFFGNTPERREEYIKTMSSFYSSFSI